LLLNVREASPEAKEKPSAREWNPFRLYRNHPDLKEAEAKLKVACAEAAAKIKSIQNQYANCGASDTDSRSAITGYIWDLLLYPPERRAADIALWRQVVIEGKSKPTTQRSLDLESANRLLNNMDDADLLATLKLGKEKLPWVREQIKILDAKYKAELEAITQSPEFKRRVQQHWERWQKQQLGRKQQQQT